MRYAAEGDKARIKIVKVNKSYAFGIVESILSPSENRRVPLCPSYGKCGGCTMMHILYEKQLSVKKQTVVNNLRKIAHLNDNDYVFDEIIGADEYNYRNKAQFPLSLENGKAIYGFYAPGSHRVVKCHNCKIQNFKINQVADAVLQYVNENNISIYDEKTQKGFLRHIYVRSAKNGEFILVLVTSTSKELPNVDILVKKLTELGGMGGIVQNVNKRTDNVIMGDKNIVLYGKSQINMSIGNLKFLVSPNSFFQVNTDQTEKLYSRALKYAGLSGDETVFDLYCGVGSISLFLAQSAKKVYGVEIVEEAIVNARKNAEINGIDNAEFFAGDCTEVVDDLIEKGINADVVVVDPPRKGCDGELLNLINKISPEKIVYVSCNSSTLARDISLLSDFGYKLKKVTAVDMFPQTAHVECVAQLWRE